MRYLPWALVALGAYSFVAPLMSVATTGEVRIPSTVAAMIANTTLVVGTVAVVAYTGGAVGPYLSHPKTPYVLAGGAFLTVGILAYYRALALGPVSVVVPVFGLFLVVSSVIGVVFLDEAMTARKGAGIVLALVAVYLVSVE